MIHYLHTFSYYVLKAFLLDQERVEDGQLEGISVCRSAPKLSHLFFTDDNLIFCKASLQECDSLQRIL